MRHSLVDPMCGPSSPVRASEGVVAACPSRPIGGDRSAPPPGFWVLFGGGGGRAVIPSPGALGHSPSLPAAFAFRDR